MRRRSFFSPTNQGDQPCVRITEQTLHSGSGTKAREGVCIDQTTRFASSWHPAIMPNFGPAARALGSSEYRGLRVIGPRFLPTPNHEDPLNKTGPQAGSVTFNADVSIAPIVAASASGAEQSEMLSIGCISVEIHTPIGSASIHVGL